MSTYRFRLIHLFGLMTAIAIAIWAAQASYRTYRHAIALRTIVAMDFPGGQRLRLIQDFNGEPWDTQLFFDSGDGQWGQYDYDHEDWYWNAAEVEIHGDVVHVLRGGRSTIQLNLRTGYCVVDRTDGRHEEYREPFPVDSPLRVSQLTQVEQ